MGGRGSKSSRGGAAAPEQTDAEKHGFSDDALTPYERNDPDHLAKQVESAKQDGWMRGKNPDGVRQNLATPAPKGAPKFPATNAERGTLMYRDGDKSKPVMVSRARAKGPNGESMAVVSTVERRTPPPGMKGKGWGLKANEYAISRTRLQHGGKDLLSGGRRNNVPAADIFGK